MRTVGIGVQDFGKLLESGLFYVDKTKFIREWWKSQAEVTLITRPRRFGKTLTMSMVERFFSIRYADGGEIFGGLEIWKDKECREVQGRYPVIRLSFSDFKGRDYEDTVYQICSTLQELYRKYRFLLDSDKLMEEEKACFREMMFHMQARDIPGSLKRLSEILFYYYGKKVIILLDEYDTPAQEAYLGGYWDDLVQCFRGMFNSAFKTNPYLERGIITGVTRISEESIFSDLNNLDVIAVTSDEYADSFGFTEQEVFSAMDEMGLDDKENVKKWYDGYVIGAVKGIYNPWSVINYLRKGKINTYWANTSSNSLVNKLIREGSIGIKKNVERLLRGEAITVSIDEEIVFAQLDHDENAIWSLLLASGYLKVVHKESVLQARKKKTKYELELTNMEINVLFKDLVSSWFDEQKTSYNSFIEALLVGNVEDMNYYLNRIAEEIFSYFDTKQREPEKFYHGFVLGLLVDLENDYVLTSNRESGGGRYDVMIEPKDRRNDAIIIEFKAVRPNQSLEDTVASALAQIEEKKYEQSLWARGFSKEKIKKYGFAFEGKKVLIGTADDYTEGDNFVDAIEMARDAIGLAGISMADNKEEM